MMLAKAILFPSVLGRGLILSTYDKGRHHTHVEVAMHLICRQCATRFTPELRLIPFDPREDAVEEEFVARGNVMQAEKSFYFDTNVGSFIAHIEDTQHMKLTSDSIRLQGCCGLDGGNGPNLQCAVCGTYVATKRTDCWTPHYIVFETSTTQAVMDEAR